MLSAKCQPLCLDFNVFYVILSWCLIDHSIDNGRSNTFSYKQKGRHFTDVISTVYIEWKLLYCD